MFLTAKREPCSAWTRLSSALAVWLLAAALSVAAALPPSDEPLPLRVQAGECNAELAGEGTRGPYLLPCAFPNPATLLVLRGERRLQPGIDFFLDIDTNTLSFARRLDPGEGVKVHYRCFPFPLPRELQYVDPDSLPEPHPVAAEIGLNPPILRPDVPSTLFITGSKTVGIHLGDTGEPAVEQSLRVTLFGNLSEDIEVNGVLSDQSVPFQPEGTTTELDEIDKIFVQVQGSHFRALLGDQVINHDRGDWVRFERIASGARGELRGRGLGGELAGLVSKGRFATSRFLGQEGSQGPYPLTTGLERNILILAGSERVWIDGVAMVRGANRDYVIDYETGEITFTAQRLITSEQEIVVDFEYSADRYRRTISMGRAQGGEGRLRAELLLFREGDDPDEPLFRSFDAEDLAALEGAGGDVDFAHREGAILVEPGSGDYIKEEQFDGREGFTYVPGAGDYQVSFAAVGSGAGNYRRELPYDGTVYYVYAGQNGGDWDPVILLPLPVRLEVADLRLEADLGQHWSAACEGALTRAEANLLSERDRAAVDGALALSLRLSSLPWSPGGRDWGQLSGRIQARQQGEGFTPPGRELDLETIEGWGLDNALRATARNRYDLDLLHRLRPWLRWQGLAGYRGGDRLGTTRGQLQLEGGQPNRGPAIAARVNQVRRTRAGEQRFRFREYSGELSWRGRLFSPLLGAEREERTDSLAVREYFDDLRVGLNGATEGGIKLSAEERWRWEYESAANQTQRRARATTSTLSAEVGGGRSLGLRADLSHRVRHQGAAVNRSDLLQLESSYLPRNQILAINASYGFSGGEAELAVERYVPAIGDSLPGQYSYDPERGIYYFDPEDGDFARIIERTGERERVLRASAEADLRIHPERGPDPGRWARLLAFEGSLRLEEKSSTGERWDLALLRPAVLRVPGQTLRGILESRADFLLHPGAPSWNLRLRLAASRSLDDPAGISPRSRSTDLQSVRLRTQPHPDYSLEVDSGLEQEEELSPALALDRISDSQFLAAVLTRGSGRRWELFLRTELRRDDLLDRGVESRLLALAGTPGVRWNLPGRGRVVVEAGAERLRSTGASVPISARAGRELGTTWRLQLNADYRITDVVTISGDLRSALEPDSGLRNRGTVRVSAFF